MKCSNLSYNTGSSARSTGATALVGSEVTMKRRTRLMLQLVALLSALAIVPVAAASEPYDFYALVALTGPAAFLGRGEASTLGVFEKYVNATGGIGGRPLHIIVQDDQSNPAVAVQLANQIIAKHVPAFVGPSFGAT